MLGAQTLDHRLASLPVLVVLSPRIDATPCGDPGCPVVSAPPTPVAPVVPFGRRHPFSGAQRIAPGMTSLRVPLAYWPTRRS